MNEAKYLTVAKQVYDNMPFTNKQFNFESVNAIAARLKILVNNNHLTETWIDGVYKAAINNQPIYIDLSNDWNWSFLTMKHGTREELLAEVSKLKSKK